MSSKLELVGVEKEELAAYFFFSFIFWLSTSRPLPRMLLLVGRTLKSKIKSPLDEKTCLVLISTLASVNIRRSYSFVVVINNHIP